MQKNVSGIWFESQGTYHREMAVVATQISQP